MMSSNFENKLNQNHSPEIGRIIDESFVTFKKTVWVSGVGILLLLLFILPITIFIIFKVMEIESLEEFVKISPTLGEDFNYLLLNAAIAIPLAALTAPITAGFYKINHLAKQDKEFGLSNLFDYYKGPYFKHLALTAVLTALYSNILGLGLIYLNFQFVATLIQLFIAFLFVLSVPLIIFENQSALTAMSNSSRLTIKHPFTIIVCLLLAFLFALLGLFAFCVGIFFTVSYFYTMNYTIYNEIIPIENKNSFDDIGKE